MIYTALKKFDRALYFLEVVITTPAMAVSHIMLEAYKKYILVCLILHGKVCNSSLFLIALSLRYSVNTLILFSKGDKPSKIYFSSGREIHKTS